MFLRLKEPAFSLAEQEYCQEGMNLRGGLNRRSQLKRCGWVSAESGQAATEHIYGLPYDIEKQFSDSLQEISDIPDMCI